MFQRLIPLLATLLATLFAGGVLYLWIRSEPLDLYERNAELLGSKAEAKAEATARIVDLTGCFKLFPEISEGKLQGSWLGFRGNKRDNIAYESSALFTSWPDSGPEVLWQTEVGDGHAMPAIANGCAYLLDYDEARSGDVLKCLNADTGAIRWEHLYRVKTKRNHGISRTVVATDSNSVVSIGPQCHVISLVASNGTYQWGMDLVARYGTKVPLWYTGQCPLIDNNMVILAPAGTNVVLCGIDLVTGKTVFETPAPGGLDMSHSSVILMTVDGVRQYVYAALGGIIGVAADGDARGKLLWKTTAFTPTVVAPSPVPLNDGRFFMTAGYGFGSVMFRVSKDASNTWKADVLYKRSKKEFACEQQTPILLNGLLYSVIPNDGGSDRQQLACMTLDGERLWTSGKDDMFGLGPFLATPDGLIYLLNDTGRLTLARINSEGYTRLARHDIFGGKGRDAWGPMILINNRLFLRESTRLLCLKVGDERE
jgi:outer membrane protein assembly factor BamB